MDFETFKKGFAYKLRELRNLRNISAREMSLSLGQNVNYVNYIENGRHLPSMQGFFSICEYLCVSPSDFFSTEIKSSAEDAREMTRLFRRLSPRQSKYVLELLRDLTAEALTSGQTADYIMKTPDVPCT